jgi:hypothetical protein
MVSILSTDSPNTIVSSLVSAITTAMSGIFNINTTQGANITDVKVGDIVTAHDLTWSANNQTTDAGDSKIAGFPVIAVDVLNRTFDVVNPFGSSMSATAIGAGYVSASSTFAIDWKLKHDLTTKYAIQKLGFNSLCRLSKIAGTSPMFVTCGVAVDDILKISGTTFNSFNSGSFKVLAVDENSVIFENSSAVEELDTLIDFNDLDIDVIWTSNSNTVSGIAGAFANLSVGKWVKKSTDDASLYVQVIARNGTGFADATQITLGSAYAGTSATAKGVSYDQMNDVGGGLFIRDIHDISFSEGDSSVNGDTLYVSNISSPYWFTSNNSGNLPIVTVGTDAADYRIFVRVINAIGSAQSDVKNNVLNAELVTIEGSLNKFETTKVIEHIAIDEFDPDKRIVYLTPGNRSYKWSQSNTTKLSSIGKIGFDSDVVTGTDGYYYYTGLLRSVQRTIDGFEPDEITYAGRKAVGSVIEILPPLVKNVKITLNITTKNGVNLSEITNEIKSAVINYVNYLDVGTDVVLSDIIVKVKAIDGVAAVTFITPAPSEERISAANNEKMYIRSNDISIA